METALKLLVIAVVLIIAALVGGIIIGAEIQKGDDNYASKVAAELKNDYALNIEAHDRIAAIANGWQYNGQITSDTQLLPMWSELNDRIRNARGLEKANLRVTVEINPVDIIK